MASTYAHTFDAKANFTSNSNPSTTGFTCGIGTAGDATLLCCGIVVGGTAVRTGGAPTYNGVALTQADSTRTGAETISELWYLLDPSTGSSYTLSIPNNGKTLYVTLASFCANNPERYKSVFDSATGNTTTSTNTIVTTTTTYNGSVLFQIMGNGNNAAPTANNQILLYAVDRGNYSDDSQYALQTDAGTINFTWTVGNGSWTSSLGVWRVGTRKRYYHID